jgi:hypothetical protein
MSAMSPTEKSELKNKMQEDNLKDEQAALGRAAEAAATKIMEQLDPKDPASVRNFEAAMAEN